MTDPIEAAIQEAEKMLPSHAWDAWHNERVLRSLVSTVRAIERDATLEEAAKANCWACSEGLPMADEKHHDYMDIEEYCNSNAIRALKSKEPSEQECKMCKAKACPNPEHPGYAR